MKIPITQARDIEKFILDFLLAYKKSVREDIRLPIPISLIAERVFQFQVEMEDFESSYIDTRGLLIPQLRLIIASSFQSDSSFDFTVAHELAHWLLIIFLAKREPNLEDLKSVIKSKKPYEIENLANYIASALLIPFPILIHLAGSLENISPEKFVDLQGKFQVSDETLKYRIEDLLFLKRRGYLDFPGSKKPNLRKLTFDARSLKVHEKIIVDLRCSEINYSVLRKLDEYRKSSLKLQVLIRREDYFKIFTIQLFGIANEVVIYNGRREKDAYIRDEARRSSSFRYEIVDNSELLSRIRENLNKQKQDSSSVFMFARKGNSSSLEMSVLSKDELNQIIIPRVVLNTKAGARDYIREKRAKGKRVVLVIGNYDSMRHTDSVFLNDAKRVGDFLVVGIESNTWDDAQVDKQELINDIYQRVELLNKSQLVDHVFVIQKRRQEVKDKFYINLLNYLKPDLIALDEACRNAHELKRQALKSRIPLYQFSSLSYDYRDILNVPRLLDQALKEKSVVILKLDKLEEINKDRNPAWMQLSLPNV